jgi:hypothetical protein
MLAHNVEALAMWQYFVFRLPGAAARPYRTVRSGGLIKDTKAHCLFNCLTLFVGWNRT